MLDSHVQAALVSRDQAGEQSREAGKQERRADGHEREPQEQHPPVVGEAREGQAGGECDDAQASKAWLAQQIHHPSQDHRSDDDPDPAEIHDEVAHRVFRDGKALHQQER